VCLHHSVALSQLNVADINFNASSITAVVHHLAAMCMSGNQHVPGHTVRATVQGQAL
jgi:hypothetical protein